MEKLSQSCWRVKSIPVPAAFLVDGDGGLGVAQTRVEEGIFDAIGFKIDGQFLSGVGVVLDVAVDGVGLFGRALHADRVGADGIGTAFVKDHLAAPPGFAILLIFGFNRQVLLAFDGVVFIQVTEPLDLGEGIERSAGAVVLADGVLDGGEQFGLDAPAAFMGDMDELLALVALQDQLHGGFALQGVETDGLVLVHLDAGLFEAGQVGLNRAAGEPEVPLGLGALEVTDAFLDGDPHLGGLE